MLDVSPQNPMTGQNVVFMCNSSVPQNLNGVVSVSIVGPNGTLTNAISMHFAQATYIIPSITDHYEGAYRCEVIITSPFLQNGGSSQPLQDSDEIQLQLQSMYNILIIMHVASQYFCCSSVISCQSDVDDCGMNASCVNTASGFICMCFAGFERPTGILGDCLGLNINFSFVLSNYSKVNYCSLQILMSVLQEVATVE